MRCTAWLLGPALLAGCYLSPSKHDSDDPFIEPVIGDDAAIKPQFSCASSSTCPASSPRCASGACAACIQHADCAGFPATPACGPSGACVPCAADELRACSGAAPSCDVATGQCIECSADAHCPDPQRSVCNPSSHTCEPCTTNAQCTHLPGAGQCIAGTCVECTATALDACRETLTGGAIRQYVCDAATHRCDRARLARSKTLCGGCVSDLECAAGQLCVDTPAGAGSEVCQQVQLGAALCPRPYGMTSAPLSSIDGARANVCGLLVESNTCEALRQFRNRRCGTPVSENALDDRLGSADDTKCGIEGRDDGYCVWYAPRRQYLCTTACRNSADDCPADALGCSMQTHQKGARNLCTL
ncbi:MAG: hypothetical protein ABW252_05970 [Polyangiales bacterium]